MATVPTQVRIDETLKKQATDLFSQLGMDMSSAMNIFLKQCVLRGGLPFTVELPQYRPEVIEAMEEAKKISKDTTVKSYTDMDEMFKELNA
jgi:DNA-damage-inducible protein J